MGPSILTDADRSKQSRWVITSPALYLLEQVYKMERFPSLRMRQRLAADLNVSARQVCARVASCEHLRPPPHPPPLLYPTFAPVAVPPPATCQCNPCEFPLGAECRWAPPP
jgi:hypothetical protein